MARFLWPDNKHPEVSFFMSENNVNGTKTIPERRGPSRYRLEGRLRCAQLTVHRARTCCLKPTACIAYQGSECDLKGGHRWGLWVCLCLLVPSTLLFILFMGKILIRMIPKM